MSIQPVVEVKDLQKSFHLHLQNDTHIPVFEHLNFEVGAGECLVLDGVSGMGKSSLLKCIYGSYKPQSGHVFIHFADGKVDIMNCTSQMVNAIRKNTLAYVSQFLRVMPRVPALTVVAQPLIDDGVDVTVAEKKASELLERLHIPSHLWHLSPTSFSGGEQQRINIARSFIKQFPVMLLDEPTASLDATNREVVLSLIDEAKTNGSAMLGVFHDEETREKVADRYLRLKDFIPKGNELISASA